MKTCKDCLHYEGCRGWWLEQEEDLFSKSNFDCKVFTDRSEWVHLPDKDYTFTIRGDIAKGIIIANCKDGERVGKDKREGE